MARDDALTARRLSTAIFNKGRVINEDYFLYGKSRDGFNKIKICQTKFGNSESVLNCAWGMGSEVFFCYRLIGTMSNNFVLNDLLITTKA